MGWALVRCAERSIRELMRPVALALGLAVAGSAVWISLAMGAVVTPTPLSTIGGPAHAGLYGWGAATQKDGSVLIGDYWNLRVTHYATNGTLLGPIIDTQPHAPYGLAVDPTTGNVYVCEADVPQVNVYNSSGGFLYSFGPHGTGANQFLYPAFVAINSSGVAYITDPWAHVVKAFQKNASGPPTQIFQFGSLGSGSGQFRMPHGIAVDSQGHVWVADEGNYRVQVFDSTGHFLFKVGSQGSGPGQIVGDMRGVTADLAHKWIYVVDARGGFVDKFNESGTFMLRFGSIGTGNGQFEDGGRGVTVDGSGNVWVGDLGNFRAQVFSSAGQFLFAVPAVPAPPPVGGFNGPRGVAVDAAGNVFVTDTYNERIEKFDSSGKFVMAWGMRGSGPYHFNYPRLISADLRNGDVVLADTDSNAISKYSNAGVFKWTVGGIGNGPGQFRTPYGVDVGPDGTIYVADSNNFRVVILDQNGKFKLAFGTQGNGAGQFRFPRGIDVDVDGSIWVADSGRNNVQHFSSTGGFLGSFGSLGSGAGQMNNPFGVDTNGTYVWVADTVNDRVEQWTKAGTFVQSFGGSGSGVGKMNKPQGLVLGPSGNLYVDEQDNARISIWKVQ